ncbi:hypothetical protein CPB84DRAFT_1752824 [Gymnopilus junonius]|uniref:Uncharacterized protein n=1 Tax=Gymnopilus junonius TaxID=109634 RepID=A0A9P5N991_GYMJU|nr:hypothetical protein CPB84DRAFT_1752824 [Gymnopilus junonius]
MDPPPTLPSEVLYRITNAIDGTCPEGRQSLLAFSCANRALGTICQEQIFHDVEISYTARSSEDAGIILLDDEATTGHKFLDLLTSSPHIRPYVRTLAINKLLNYGRPESMSDVSIKYAQEGSNTESFSFYSIVPQLPNLEGLTTVHTKHFQSWAHLEGLTRFYFTNIVPFLTKLDLHVFPDLPFSMFRGCDNLQELHVSSLDTDMTEKSQSETGKVKLRVLEVGFPGLAIGKIPIHSWFNASTSPFDLSRLQSLTLSDLFTPISEISDMLALCAHTLEDLDFHLELNLFGVSDRFQPPFIGQTPNLGLLRNLRHLTIRTRMWGKEQSNQESNYDLLYIANALKTLPFTVFRARQLHFTLEMKVHWFTDFGSSLGLLPWTDLITVLEDDQVAPCIAGVKLKFQLHGHNDAGELVKIDVPFSSLKDILDKNMGLKELREKAILSYGCF